MLTLSIFWKTFMFHKFFIRNWYGCIAFLNFKQSGCFLWKLFFLRDFFTWLFLNIKNILPLILSLSMFWKTFMFKKFKLFLKLSLKDQILINFTKPNSYFSYVSEHDSWGWFLCLETWWLWSSATCRLCIYLIFELANVDPIKSIVNIKL